ncbi:MAG: threonine synthase [Bacteroidales bacterium]|nr:threonine synthase [Bacteroidales bacterium]
MKFCSTNNPNEVVGLKDAVLKGLADDNGLYMPVKMPRLSGEVLDKIQQLSFQEMAFEMARPFMEEDITGDHLHRIIAEALNFDVPLVSIQDNISVLELFHGPTLAFKDFGARFMARVLAYFTKDMDQEIHVLVATSGDTGSAVANGFLGVPGIKVHVLFPKGLVTKIQEKQFTTLGKNITALEVEGTFDDCQRLVKQAFLDKDFHNRLVLTSANSINLGRLIPQSFYYAYAYSQISAINPEVIVAVPSGNFGNLTAGLFAKAMGIPIKHFIAATNINDIVPQYLETSVFEPRASVSTLSNAMDVGNPSNFVRIAHMFNHSHDAIAKEITGYRFTDTEVKAIVKETLEKQGYLLDPHGAIGYAALKNYMSSHSGHGVFLETAHPAKFLDNVEPIIGRKIEIPLKLQKFIEGQSKTTPLSNRYEDLKEYLHSLK